MYYQPEPGSELDRALKILIENVLEGLDHGYFEYTIQCEMANNNKRVLTIGMGKSHRFLIPPGDLRQ